MYDNKVVPLFRYMKCTTTKVVPLFRYMKCTTTRLSHCSDI